MRYENRYRCRSCRVKFSLLSHTWLKDVRVPLPSFWLVLWCWTKQIPVKQTEDIASLSEKGVRHWFDLFRTHLPENQEILEHIVQLDEVYFGKFGRLALLMGKQIGSRKLAYDLGITYYDASFLSLAKQYNATLITQNIKHQGKTKHITVKSLSSHSDIVPLSC